MPSNPQRSIASGASSLAIGCIGLFSSALPVMAQGTDSTSHAADQGQNLGGVTVTDTAVDEGSYRVERQASAKATAPLLDTPRSITVVSRQVLEDTNSTTLAEALRTVPGITMGAGEAGTAALGDRPYIRGADSSNSIYIDGIHDIATQTRETFAVDSIEVVKGSDSVTNGSTNAGGSVNMISKTPKDKRFVQVDANYGSADYKRFTLDVNQPLSEFVGVRLSAMYHDQGIAGRDYTWQKRWGIAPSIKFGLNGPTSLELDWYHVHTNELPDQGIPYQYVIANQPSANYQTAPVGTDLRSRGTFYGLTDRDFRTTNTDSVSARFEHTTDGGLKIRNTARYTNATQEYVWTQPDDSKGNVATYGTVTRRANSRYSTVNGYVDQLDFSGKFATGALKHSFALAAEYNWQKAGYGSFYANSAYTALPTSIACPTATSGTNYNCTTVGNPNPNDPYVGTIVRGPANSMTLATSTNWALSAFDTITINDKFIVNLGGRYDYFNTNASAALAAPFTGTRTWYGKADNIFTYQAGLAYKPRPNGNIYLSTSSAAIAPGSFIAQGAEDNSVNGTNTVTGAVISANDLKVQRTTSYELGTKWNLFQDNLTLSFDVFQTRTTNARTTDPTTGGVVYVGTKRVRGIELGFSGNVTPKWNIFGGYSYMPSKVTNAGTTATVGTDATGKAATVYMPAATLGKAFPNTPQNSFTLFTNYKVTPKFTLGGGAIFMDTVYGGFSDTRQYVNGVFSILKTRATYVPSYWRFDANASYKINDMLSLRVNALNLTNKLYYDQAYPTHYAHQAAGRTVIGTVSFKY
ncbi:TonB-dependent receptor [Novosphingobium terrae]|uniref:TonB-dependent receptor n=1 Tax=Novosphingobium terrae TaxID=2726189 RepID=UPI001F1444FE|nr:TonB-dependent receptor [Novosphingobium terrae]